MNNRPVRNVHAVGTERENGVGHLDKWAEWNLHCHGLDGQLDPFLVGPLHDVVSNVRFLHCSRENGHASDSFCSVKRSSALRQTPDAVFTDGICGPFAL
jgi:hypothetical protein